MIEAIQKHPMLIIGGGVALAALYYFSKSGSGGSASTGGVTQAATTQSLAAMQAQVAMAKIAGAQNIATIQANAVQSAIVAKVAMNKSNNDTRYSIAQLQAQSDNLKTTEAANVANTRTLAGLQQATTLIQGRIALAGRALSSVDPNVAADIAAGVGATSAPRGYMMQGRFVPTDNGGNAVSNGGNGNYLSGGYNNGKTNVSFRL